MIKEDKDTVTICIDSDDLVKSIALLENMRDFCDEQTEEDTTETSAALTVAIETMKAFGFEHFENGEEEG